MWKHLRTCVRHATPLPEEDERSERGAEHTDKSYGKISEEGLEEAGRTCGKNG